MAKVNYSARPQTRRRAKGQRTFRALFLWPEALPLAKA